MHDIEYDKMMCLNYDKINLSNYDERIKHTEFILKKSPTLKLREIILSEDNIIEFVFNLFNVERDDVSRKHEQVYSRMLCSYLFYRQQGLTLSKISSKFTKRYGLKHDTVLHYLKSVSKERIIYNPKLSKMMNALNRRLNINDSFQYTVSKYKYK